MLHPPQILGLIAIRPTLLSFAMHTAGINELKLPFIYTTFNTENTKGVFEAMRILNIRGYSLTIPHKESSVVFVDEMSEEARNIGAINTAVFDGLTIRGENTDWIGITMALKELKSDWRGAKGLIIGAGGAARSAVYALKELNFGAISITNRTHERAVRVAEKFQIQAIEKPLGNFDLLINATPQGSHLARPQELAVFCGAPYLLDMVTNESEISKFAKNNGINVSTGERMLFFQALAQFKIFTGFDAPNKVLETALYHELSK